MKCKILFLSVGTSTFVGSLVIKFSFLWSCQSIDKDDGNKWQTTSHVRAKSVLVDWWTFCLMHDINSYFHISASRALFQGGQDCEQHSDSKELSISERKFWQMFVVITFNCWTLISSPAVTTIIIITVKPLGWELWNVTSG